MRTISCLFAQLVDQADAAFDQVAQMSARARFSLGFMWFYHVLACVFMFFYHCFHGFVMVYPPENARRSPHHHKNTL